MNEFQGVAYRKKYLASNKKIEKMQDIVDIAKRIVDKDPSYETEPYQIFCPFCNYPDRIHATDCPWKNLKDEFDSYEEKYEFDI